MTLRSNLAIAGLIVAIAAYSLRAQQSFVGRSKQDGTIRLDVVVTNGSSKLVSGLPSDGFKLLDNGVQRDLLTFKEVATPANPVEVVIVVDAVNTPYLALSYQRDEIMKYLRGNGGRLTHVTSFAVLTDQGMHMFNHPSKDGIALASALKDVDIGLRVIGRDQGFYGAQDRLSLSLNALGEIAAYEKKLPGRKLVVWVSPGWPLLPGVYGDLTSKQEQQIYSEIVSFSTQLRDAGITLDSVNSWGAGEALGRATEYEDFLNGISKPYKAEPGNLGLQVLATQSGGLVLNSSDIVGMMRQSVADRDDYYELSFQPAPSDKPNEYHRLQVEVGALKVRTRQSYYTQAPE